MLKACLILLLLCSCSSQPSTHYTNLPFDRLHDEAVKSSVPVYCLVLIDDDSQISFYKDKIETEKNKRAIWNFCNTNDICNKWYTYIVGNNKRPLTILFNQHDEIINIVFGTSKYAKCSIQSSINSTGESIDYPQFGYVYFDPSLKEPNRYLTKLFSIQKRMNERADSKSIQEELNTLLTWYKHPYTCYLQIKSIQASSTNGDTKEIQTSIRQWYNNKNMSHIYGKDFLSTCQIDSCSQLILSTQLDKESYTVGDRASIWITLQNTTNKELCIKEIDPSCDCMIPIGEQSKVIRAQGNAVYHFEMEMDKAGEIYREISFYLEQGAAIYTAEIQIKCQTN